MLSFFRGSLDRLFAVLGAVLFLQVPLFMQAYIQRLGGHIDELIFQINRIQRVAETHGKTLDQMTAYLRKNSDPIVSSQGEVYQGMVSRFHDLSLGYQSLNHAPIWKKPILFFKFLDTEIAKGTINVFEPGIPITIEGAIYGLLGMAFGSVIFFLLSKLFVNSNTSWSLLRSRSTKNSQ